MSATLFTTVHIHRITLRIRPKNHAGLRVVPVSLPDINQHLKMSTNDSRGPNSKFHEYWFSDLRVIMFGRTDKHGEISHSRCCGFGGLEVACWPLVPGRSRRIFQSEKILSTPSFGREVKPFIPCRRFTACKISLNVTWKTGIFRQNSSAISRPSSSSFHY